LPTDCVQPREVYAGTRNPAPEDAEPFDRLRNAADDGFVLACDVRPVTSGTKAPVLFYPKRATTVTEYPQPFVHFLAASLAAKLAMPVMGPDEKGMRALKVATELRRIRFIDAVRFDVQSVRRDRPPPTPSLAARGSRRRR
jgi:hypothetical protein